MLATPLLVLSEEERVVDPQLGYPLGYAKLCSQQAAAAAAHGHGQQQQEEGGDSAVTVFTTPYSRGPPQRFLPYSPVTQNVSCCSCCCHSLSRSLSLSLLSLDFGPTRPEAAVADSSEYNVLLMGGWVLMFVVVPVLCVVEGLGQLVSYSF
jgi:hypothetical protein